jgi:hypothetical protein
MGIEAAEVFETNYKRYKPSSSVAPIGSQIIQFTYSEEFLNAMAAGDTVALHADLDAFAWKLCDEIDNPMGIAKSDIAILHDLYYVTEYRPYEFSDPWFAQPANGGTKFLLDQGPRYQADVLGDPVYELHTPDAYNHIDIFFKNSGPNQYAHPGEISANVADFGDEPGFPTRKTNRNGIILRSVPVGPDWSSYHIAIHELGHLFDITAYGSQDYRFTSSSNNKRGYGQEPRAQLGRRYVGISNELHFINGRPTGVPYNQCFYRHDEGPAGGGNSREEVPFDYNPNTRGEAHGETMFAYMAEHFRGSSSTSVADDLAAEFMTNTYFEPNGERVANTYIAAVGTLLEGQAYASESAYPYFFGPSGPLNGEDRLGVMWRNMAIAVAANAPNIDVGQYGFPFEYDPHFQWNYFKSITAHLDPPTPADRVETPVISTITSNDYGSARTIPSPHTMPDGSQYYWRVHPWNMEVFVFHTAGDVDANLDREIRISLEGTGTPYSHPSSDYRHEVSASLVFYEELAGASIHDADDKILAIEHLDPQVVSGDLVFEGVVPTHQGARSAMIVVTMVEKGLPAVYADTAHPLYNQPEAPWVFSVTYELRDRTPSIRLMDETLASGLSTTGTPYASSFRDYSINENPAFGVSREDGATLHFRRTGISDGVPEHLNEASSVGFQPTTAERGMASADYDGDGDIDLFVAHATLPRLYNFDATRELEKYVDVSSSVMVGANTLSSVAQDSWSGSWADYDGDGYLDLYITRAESPSSGVSHTPASIDDKGLKDVLLRNLGYAGPGFEDVTVAAGLYDADSETVSASWADINNDGRPDLYVSWLGAYHGNFTLGWSPLYLNKGDGTFTDITYPSGQVPY